VTKESSITAGELASLTGRDTEEIRRLREAGLLTPTTDGRHEVGDVHRVRLIAGFIESGIPLDSIAGANREGAITLSYYDRLHAPPGMPSQRTYQEIDEELGDLARGIFAAIGLAEPEPSSRLPVADEDQILELAEVVRATGTPDLALRVVRLLSDALQRASEAIMSVYDEAVDRIDEQAGGIPPSQIFERYLLPWARFARLAPQQAAWLVGRHLSNAIDGYTVTSTEHHLAAMGYVAPREEAPPAVAFVDLSGFTRLGEQRGDEQVARVALDFAALARRHATAAGGGVVKLLGDGVLLRFPDPSGGIEGTLSLLDALCSSELPSGHAGIHAGPLIIRDGDVFGRTVNLASRIADVAPEGVLMATQEMTHGLEERYRVESAGTVELRGIVEPVELVQISRA
jgi:adenylate cyclase